MTIKILLAGDGGQGIQLISEILTQAAFANDFNISQIPNYGLEQRGGVSLSFLQISDTTIAYPKFTKPNLLLILSEQAKTRTKQFQDADFVMELTDYEATLKENNILIKSYNVFFLGVISKILQEKNIINTDEVFKLLEKKLANKNNWEENKKTWELSLKI